MILQSELRFGGTLLLGDRLLELLSCPAVVVGSGSRLALVHARWVSVHDSGAASGDPAGL